MNYFPALLNIEYKTAVVVGGGHVARQKVEALLPAKAKIVVVSPDVTKELKAYIERGEVTWLQKQFEPADLDDATIIFAVTNSEVVNDAVEQAAQHWQLLSRADAKGRVDFINPAVVRRGELVLTASTLGNFPAMTRIIKAELAAAYPEYYADYVAFLGDARQQLLAKYEGKQKKAQLAALLEPTLLQWIKEGELTRCKVWLEELLGE